MEGYKISTGQRRGCIETISLRPSLTDRQALRHLVKLWTDAINRRAQRDGDEGGAAGQTPLTPSSARRKGRVTRRLAGRKGRLRRRDVKRRPWEFAVAILVGVVDVFGGPGE